WRLPLVIFFLLAVGAAAIVLKVNAGRATTSAAQQGSGRRAGEVPVAAAPARIGDVPIYLSGLGSVTPVNTVVVKSRVDGQLIEVLFQEGQEVTQGEPLARIDSRPFEA